MSPSELSSQKIFLKIFSQRPLKEIKQQLNIDSDKFEMRNETLDLTCNVDVVLVWGEIAPSFEQELLDFSKQYIPILAANIPQDSWLRPVTGNLAHHHQTTDYLDALATNLDFYQSWIRQQRLEHGQLQRNPVNSDPKTCKRT